ncbi:GTPase [Eubacterium sp. An11]|uniref:TIGR03943 family putative permease subunit n=1 Tax=Eubacterium sp. An11 TaxID=1965542 RepID=UPI000B3A8F7F|nr:GTP-binding protein [Eubacterium sp. An11]OUQ64400.1 GTPase [Eubacterium sp. An11]
MPGKKEMEIPVYVFMGFLESGKTTFIQETLEEDYFNNGERTLLFACEEGMEEYDEDLLKKTNTTIVYVEEEEDFNKDFLISKVLQYYPDRVIIEYNGMWSVERMLTEMDNTPLLVFQTIVTVNGETFDLYMNNMRSLAVEMYKIAEMVIINRCTPEMPRATWRRSIKAVNRRVQVLFESVDDDDMGEEDDTLPFDTEGDEIHLEDEDYGIWFVDAMERPEVYNGKTMVMKTRVFKSIRLPKGCFVPGRHAMTCCADDIQFIGYLCHTNHAKSSTIKSLKNKMWVNLTAEVRIEYNKEYGEEGPVLYAKRVEVAEPPEEELVYF